MTTPLSLHAQQALQLLNESWMVNWSIHSDAARTDSDANIKYNESRAYYLGSQQVCHAANALNTYCQSMLAEILKKHDSVWDEFPKGKTTRDEMIEKLASHKGNDKFVREYFRDKLKSFWSPESDVIVILRHKFVHQNGYDPKREVEAEIQSKAGKWCEIFPVELNPNIIPVRYLDGDRIDADAELGNWACVHIRNHIHLMDQNVCHTFELPRQRWRPRPMSRQITSPVSKPAPRPLVFSQPTHNLVAKSSQTTGKTAPMSSKSSNVSQEEIACARAWLTLQKEMPPFIDGYVKEAGVDIRGMSAGIVGHPLPHTIKGQERSLEYDLAPFQQSDFNESERICIRLRERNFVPYVTVWSRRAPMRDFITPALSTELQDYIRDVIDKVITH